MVCACVYVGAKIIPGQIRSTIRVKLFGGQELVLEHMHLLINLFAALLRGSMVVNRVHSYQMLSIV